MLETKRSRLARTAPGLLLSLAVAAVATGLGAVVPVVGGPVFAIVLGALAAALVKPLQDPRWAPGRATASTTVLQLSIVVLGTGLQVRQVVRVGTESLPVMLGTLAVALGGAWLLGRLLDVRGDTRTLIGVGTGICGASAIAATTAVLNPKQTHVAYALGTILTCNVAAVLLFPPIGHLLDLSPHAFGLWAGTAINDTSSVVAAAYAYGGDAGEYALVVKLTRTLMLVPVIAFLAIRANRRGALPWHRVVPPFLLGFVAAVVLGSLGVVPAGVSALGPFLITTALAGIGLSLRPNDLRRAGGAPLLLGVLLWLAVAGSSLGLQALTGTL
ncbi:YeiH family protein [Umezawaea sp.]|uniref:YeiH family protein n=1 Tax=Umezawaea sp. TaxID=1955258 RepID=UPI002ED66BE7